MPRGICAHTRNHSYILPASTPGISDVYHVASNRWLSDLPSILVPSLKLQLPAFGLSPLYPSSGPVV